MNNFDSGIINYIQLVTDENNASVTHQCYSRVPSEDDIISLVDKFPEPNKDATIWYRGRWMPLDRAQKQLRYEITKLTQTKTVSDT